MAPRPVHQLILGIDPGTLRTGFGVVERIGAQDLSHVAHGTIVLDAKKNISERLQDLALDLSQVIQKYRPTCAVVEDVFLYKNARSALVLGQARGAVIAVLGLHRVSMNTLSPTSVKSLITGRGRAQKFQVAHMVALNLNIAVPASIDASDALALALALGHKIKNN